jgi:hypothetical protein
MSVTYEGVYADVMKRVFSRGALLIELEELNKNSESNLKLIEMEINNPEKRNEVTTFNYFRLKKELGTNGIESKYGRG